MNSTPGNESQVKLCTNAVCVFISTANTIICILGTIGNGLVIWITGFKIKKSVNRIWYLSLAVSDLLLCATLSLFVFYFIKKDWVLGDFMCKFRSFFLLLNMFSSIFLLVIISVDRCLVVMFPVWVRNNRTVRKALVVVLLAWIISAALSVSYSSFRDVKENSSNQTKICYYNYNKKERTAVVVSKFIFGFVIPFLVIIVCYVLIMRKLKNKQMAKNTKPFKIMTLLIAVFFVCWLPMHILSMMKIKLQYRQSPSPVFIGQKFATTLAHANSLLNPILYMLMGKSVKTTYSTLLSKLLNAMEEEDQKSVQGTPLNSGTLVSSE
ncbi:chemerin-like receptor 1 [Trichomycterus rosablanca]|uniref:chemerin-like receptor 1 n=1 Tax=Trichomycterus rosablanca TaxID=2290929 RepID=UPI002F358A83